MEVKLELRSWSVAKDAGESTKLKGKFAVMCGATEVATQEFNNGYGSKEMAFPAGLMADIESLEARIGEHLQNKLK